MSLSKQLKKDKWILNQGRNHLYGGKMISMTEITDKMF